MRRSLGALLFVAILTVPQSISAQLVPSWAIQTWCLPPGEACFAFEEVRISPFFGDLDPVRRPVIDVFGGFVTLPQHYQSTAWSWTTPVSFENGTVVATQNGARAHQLGPITSSTTGIDVPVGYGDNVPGCTGGLFCRSNALNPDSFTRLELSFTDASGQAGSWACDPSGANAALSRCLSWDEAVSVPEPGTWLLLITGLLALACVQRTRRGSVPA